MAEFTAKKLKESRVSRGLSLDEASEAMKISRRRLIYIESNEREVTSDEILDFAKLYKVDVRELLLESYAEESEEQILSNRYISLLRLYDQLSDRDKEDVIWVIKQRIEGRI
jgi:transcriptional regulator with XRE-family HTH domain